MELSREILCKINVPTISLTVETIQELLVLTKENSKHNLSIEFWEEVARKLWKHLNSSFEKYDDHFLCATCFYSVITLADKVQYYMVAILQIIKSVQNSQSWGAVALMYGMFQSSFLTQMKNLKDILNISDILKEVFDLLHQMGYEYSQYTYIVFNTLKSFKKVCGGPLEKMIFNKQNQVKLLALVNHNWENPIAGVRDLNRSIFQTLITTLDKATYEIIVKEIDSFYWNKAKYLMFSAIINTYKGDIMTILNFQWIDGLIYSLHKPGLVSAGADMYFSLLKKINTQDDWCQFFLCRILNVLHGNNSKAIENFSNYWCLTTMKKFELIVHVLLEELERLEDSEQLLYSKLCIIRQANRQGIFDKHWVLAGDDNSAIREAVLTGIEHCNDQIRLLAFDFVCVVKAKSIPSQSEYDLILKYLDNNVNSDSVVLRLSMITSFSHFLNQLNHTFINVIMKDSSYAFDNLLQFCSRLQNLIIKNLNMNGNYQRKVTTVKLCNSVLTFLNEIPRKKRHQTRQVNITLIGFLKEKNNWSLSDEIFINKLVSLLKDPTDDIREYTIHILLTHYSKELQCATLVSQIIQDAKKSIRSKFFYEISCGQSMFRLITTMLIKTNHSKQEEYDSVENIFNFAYNELNTEHKANRNVMNSIEAGKQLHAFMGILLVVLEECVLNNYKIDDIQNKLPNLLNILSSISNQFAWEEEGSSDFSKMNEMVQNIIDTSDYNTANEDSTQISGLQQIVLNCLWLNVKASCDLASIIIRYSINEDANTDTCEKCLNIITRVLETSRHKGAIEAAGVALGKGVQYLTSLPEKVTRPVSTRGYLDVSELPRTLLQQKLEVLTFAPNKMSSITRRGAGLSIMMHRIVSSDKKKGKPLFHHFIKTLLRTCKQHTILKSLVEASGDSEDGIYEAIKQSDDPEEFLFSCEPRNTNDNIENKVDLPIAINIHLLTRIVTDSSSATDIMYYAVEVAELAFSNLTSPHWQIRNAALQLYGALIPRLIGQKKASGADEETIATVSCDEMRTHLPKLWQYAINQLRQDSNGDILQTHSNLIPILNVLASSAKRYNFSLHKSEDETEFNDLFYVLMLLLNSPIYTVRRLTAKTIFNMYDYKYISESILNQEKMTENLLHGSLLLLELCKNYYLSDSKEDFIKLNKKFNTIFSSGSHSYVCRKLYEDIFVTNIEFADVENCIKELKDNNTSGVGIHLWANSRFEKYLNNCSWDDGVLKVIKLLLQHSDHDKYLQIILRKMGTQNLIPADVLMKIAKILITFEERYSSSIIWEILYRISLKMRISTEVIIDVEELLNKSEKQPYNLRYMIPLLARCIDNAKDNESIARLLQIIENLSNFEISDVDMRYIAAVANNELAREFIKLTDSHKIISIKCCIMLLQDEDEDVRNLSAKFYTILNQQAKAIQPYICLNKILDKNLLTLSLVSPQQSIDDLKQQLTATIAIHANHNIDEYNPFANDSKNVFFEPNVLTELVKSLNFDLS